MTQGIALARAVAMNGAWDEFTHLGSNSGGNWFATQFVYSQAFHEAVTDTSKSLGAFVTQWGAGYGDVLNRAVDSGALWATTFNPGSFISAIHVKCFSVN
jgi:hypothetical protein